MLHAKGRDGTHGGTAAVYSSDSLSVRAAISNHTTCVGTGLPCLMVYARTGRASRFNHREA